MINSKEMKIATSSNNKNSFTIISDNNDENKENIPPSTMLLLKSLTLDCKHDDDQNNDSSDGSALLSSKNIDDITVNDDTVNDERSCLEQTDRLDNNNVKEESIVVKNMKENNGTLTKAIVKQAVLPKTAYLPNLPTLKLPKTETPPTPPSAVTTKVITLTVSPGRLGLSLKLNKSTTTPTTAPMGAIIVDIHPACAFIDKIDIGDCIISIDGREVNNFDDFKANCDRERVFDVVKGVNNNNKKMMKGKEEKLEKKVVGLTPPNTCNVVTPDKVLKNGNEKRGGVDAMISNGVLSTISNIYKRR